MVGNVGILAFQGDFAKHSLKLSALGANCCLIKTTQDLERELDGIIIPGGESTTFLKLADSEFTEKLSELISNGTPTLVTCAGLIFLADSVSNPKQKALGLLNVEVSRNGYGRQLESFITNEVELNEKYQKKPTCLSEAIFIRAPIIDKISDNIEVLAHYKDSPVLIKQENIIACTFHPELSEDNYVHNLFLKLSNQNLQ